LFWAFGSRVRLTFPVASHSIPKIVRGLKEALTENERYAVADHVVSQLKEHGDP